MATPMMIKLITIYSLSILGNGSVLTIDTNHFSAFLFFGSVWDFCHRFGLFWHLYGDMITTGMVPTAEYNDA